jgi:hypothetical protein
MLSSSLLMHLPPLKHLLVSHAPALQVVRWRRMHILTSFTTHKGCYPPTCGDTTWVITADTSSVVAVPVHYACSHLCVCARVSTWVATPIAHTKRVASRSIIRHLLRERGQFGSGFDLIMITTAKSSRLLLLHATTLQSATVLCRPTSGHLLQAHIGSPALDCKPTSGHLLSSICV